MAEKAARTRHKTMMRALGQEITSGSEEHVTDEEEWISQHCKWSDSEVERPDAAAEESEEHEGSDEHEEF